MKLTKYGFRLQFIGFSSVLSGLGIIVSILGIIEGILAIVTTRSQGFKFNEQLEQENFGHSDSILNKYVLLNGYGGLLIFLNIPYLIMWILLKIKTTKKDIPGIEKIGSVYSCVSGSLEIIGAIAGFIFPWILLEYQNLLLLRHHDFDPHLFVTLQIIITIVSAIYLIFACLKIAGTRVESNQLHRINLGFRYALFVLFIVFFTITFTLRESLGEELASIQYGLVYFISCIVYFILDIGLTVIIHSIRVDKEKNAGTGNPTKKF